jgi:hypothetical protein
VSARLRKKSPLVRPAFWLLPLVLLWIASLVLGVGGAVPYGGSNGFLDLFFTLIWAAILYIAYRLARWLLAPLLRLMPLQPTVDDETPRDPMVVCPACQTETPANDPVCQWCGRGPQ